MEKLLAALIANPWTKGIAALFIVFEIYNIGIIPAWYGTLELQKLKSDLEIATQTAKPSPERQAAEAAKARNEAKIQLGRALSARDQAKADADLAEQDAQKMKASAFVAQQSVQAEISASNSERASVEEAVKTLIGSPLPNYPRPSP